jgi:hypothetical protein
MPGSKPKPNTSPVTHRCDGTYGYDPLVTKCTMARHSDGTFSGYGCGEPCSWIMGKGGSGVPPWRTFDERRDPNEPDSELLARICLWHGIANPLLRIAELEREKAILLNVLNGTKPE